MKLESAIFLLCGVFLTICGIVYIPVSDGEPAGSVALLLGAGLCFFIGGYFWFVSRRIDARPEDRTDGEIIEGAGELGFFAPASYYPFGIAVSAVVLAVGVAFFYPWLMGVGAVMVLLAVAGLIFEFYTGQNKEMHDHVGPNVSEHV